MARFVELDSLNKLENGKRSKMLLNLDMVVRFEETSDNFCYAVIRSSGDFNSHGLTAPSFTLPYGLNQIRQIIAQASEN